MFVLPRAATFISDDGNRVRVVVIIGQLGSQNMILEFQDCYHRIFCQILDQNAGLTFLLVQN